MRVFNLTDVHGPAENLVLGSKIIPPGGDADISDDYVHLLNDVLTEYTRKRKISVNSLPPDVAAKRSRMRLESKFLDKREKKDG